MKDVLIKNPCAGGQHFGGDYVPWRRLSLVLIVITFAYFYRIDKPPLWCDEAHTGIEARNIIQYGYPTAYDGRNVNVDYNGYTLNQNLVFKYVPWSQFYLGALSIIIFGNHAAGLRLLFVIVGMCAFFPIYAILKSRVKYPDIIAGLVFVSPQILLFQRNARYYSILILLYSLVVWHLTADFKSNKTRYITVSAILIILFHTHSLAAICCCISLLLFCLLFRREALAVYFFSSCIAFLSWIVWYEILGAPFAENQLAISDIASDFGSWLKIFLTALGATLFDLDVVGCFPILLWAALFVYLFFRKTNVVLNILREPVLIFVFLSISIQAVATAALIGYESESMYAILRYMPHLVVFALICCFIALNHAISRRSLYLFMCIFTVAFSFMSLSFWARPYPRNVAVSWFMPVYAEIFRPPENAWDLIISKMKKESEDSSDFNKIILPLPIWTKAIANFYIGDRFIVSLLVNPIPEKNKIVVREIMGEQAFNRLYARPDWILIVNIPDGKNITPHGYVLDTIFPSYRISPDAGGRPELTRHTFSQSAIVSRIGLFRLQSN